MSKDKSTSKPLLAAEKTALYFRMHHLAANFIFTLYCFKPKNNKHDGRRRFIL
jgi:hypothetical protein